MAAQLIHSFSAAPGNGGPGQTFTLQEPGRYLVVADPPGSVTSLEWLASADPVRWAKWAFSPGNQIFVTAKAAPQTFRVQYGPGGSVVEIYLEEAV
jgi:hypothetical protein